MEEELMQVISALKAENEALRTENDALRSQVQHLQSCLDLEMDLDTD